jgi:hypothetical protein
VVRTVRVLYTFAQLGGLLHQVMTFRHAGGFFRRPSVTVMIAASRSAAILGRPLTAALHTDQFASSIAWAPVNPKSPADCKSAVPPYAAF